MKISQFVDAGSNNLKGQRRELKAQNGSTGKNGKKNKTYRESCVKIII